MKKIKNLIVLLILLLLVAAGCSNESSSNSNDDGDAKQGKINNRYFFPGNEQSLLHFDE